MVRILTTALAEKAEKRSLSGLCALNQRSKRFRFSNSHYEISLMLHVL